MAILHRRGRAIWIVDVQDAALRERRAAAVASRALHDAATGKRVLGIAVDLDRAAFVRGDQQRLGRTGEFEHRRVLLRNAGNLIFRTARQRNDLVLLVAMATGASDPSEGQAGAHQLKEIAARQRIGAVGVGALSGRELVALVALVLSCVLALGETAPVTAVIDSDRSRHSFGSSVGGAVVVVHGRHPGRPCKISRGAS